LPAGRNDGSWGLDLEGVTPDGRPFTYLTRVDVAHGGKRYSKDKGPFAFSDHARATTTTTAAGDIAGGAPSEGGAEGDALSGLLGRLSLTSRGRGASSGATRTFEVTLGFQGHYREGDMGFDFVVPEEAAPHRELLTLAYDPRTGEWQEPERTVL
jgi:hypothetical protein